MYFLIYILKKPHHFNFLVVFTRHYTGSGLSVALPDVQIYRIFPDFVMSDENK